jgi:hypothetical protein
MNGNDDPVCQNGASRRRELWGWFGERPCIGSKRVQANRTL